MEPEVFRSNCCPKCGGFLKVCQTNRFLCEKCGVLGYGRRDESGGYFEGEVEAR